MIYRTIMKINNVIIEPVLTEKATAAANKNTYCFIVDKKANKHAVQHAVEKIFNVTVSKVRIIVRKGKIKKVGRKSITKQQSDRKIAVVDVSKGTIPLFPQT